MLLVLRRVVIARAGVSVPILVFHAASIVASAFSRAIQAQRSARNVVLVGFRAKQVHLCVTLAQLAQVESRAPTVPWLLQGSAHPACLADSSTLPCCLLAVTHALRADFRVLQTH